MSYYGFGIQSMAYQQTPRKVFTNRFENKGRDIQLKGALSLIKVKEYPTIRINPEVVPSYGMMIIIQAINLGFLRKALMI